MNKNPSLFTKNKSQNLIILTKDGINEEQYKNKRKKNTIRSGTMLTYKGEEFILKVGLLNESDINKEKILRTVTSMKKQLIDSDNESIIKNDINNDYNINKIVISKNNLNDFFQFNNTNNFNKNTSRLNKKSSEKEMKESNSHIICKTNIEIDKNTEFEGKKKLFNKNISKYAVKSSLNEGEKNESNNISIYDYNNLNENNLIMNPSIIYNDSNYYNVINNTNKNSNFKENIFNIQNLDIINRSKNFDKENINKHNNNFKKFSVFQKRNNFTEISNSINTNINNDNDIEKEKENKKDNISENKKLIIIKKSKKIQNSVYNEGNKNIELYNKEKNSNILSLFSKKNNLIEDKTDYQINILENKKIKCFICEKFFKMSQIYVPKCQIHYMCKKCIKNYYEEQFENDNLSLKCPDTNCNKEMDFNILNNIISKIHSEMFLNNSKNDKNNNINNNSYNKGKENFIKESKLLFNSKINDENLKMYSKKHVLDINSNEKFFIYNKNKDIYCYKCLRPTLFTKANGYFIKCLNCHYRICKYCLKEFEDMHMDIMSENHCKVYYRKEGFTNDDSRKIIIFLTQLFFVFAMYYLMFAGFYFLIYRTLKKPIKLRFFRLLYYFFISLISFLLLIIFSPFLIIIYPFFPIIITMFDY